MNIGIHITGDPKNIDEDIDFCKGNNINLIQLFPEDDWGIVNKKLRDFELILHMPFWFSLFNTKNIGSMKKYLNSIRKIWVPKDRQLKCVIHTGSYKGTHSKGMRGTMLSNILSMALSVKDEILLCVENTAGSFSSMTPIIRDLVWLKDQKIPFVGICIDTEHAFANGEDIEKLPYEDADIIHLNSIPIYVKFGCHLDRHSYAYLKQSKVGVGFIKTILDTVSDDVPIILERRDLCIGASDIDFLKSINGG